MDESAITLEPVVVKTWAPTGQTPIIKCKTRSHKKISAIGAIATTPRRRGTRLFFRLHPGKSVKSKDCVAFLEQLKQNIKGPIIVVWDRLQAHRSRKVQRFVEKERGRIEIAHFPPYAPDLNPIEYAWSYLKSKLMVNHAPENEAALKQTAKDKLCEIRRQQRLLRSFVDHSHLFG